MYYIVHSYSKFYNRPPLYSEAEPVEFANVPPDKVLLSIAHTMSVEHGEECDEYVAVCRGAARQTLERRPDNSFIQSFDNFDDWLNYIIDHFAHEHVYMVLPEGERHMLEMVVEKKFDDYYENGWICDYDEIL